MKTVAYTHTARRSFRKLPQDIRRQIEGKLSRYAKTGMGDVKHLAGQVGMRIRVGDYRAIFTESGAAIVVHAVGHRRDIYR